MIELKEAESCTGLPLCLNDRMDFWPEEDCFVIAKNGFFRVTGNEDMNVILPIDKLPGAVKDAHTDMRWNGPKIPSDDLDFLCNVMWDVYLKKHTEIGIHLWYSPSTGFWYLIPKQIVSGASTDWDTDQGGMWVKNFAFTDQTPPEDARRIGCFHSHHVMAPEWSGKDDHFQKTTEYGIQLVAGWLDRGRAVRSRLAFSGVFIDVPLEDVVDFGERKTLDIPEDLFSLEETKKAKSNKKKDKKESKDDNELWYPPTANEAKGNTMFGRQEG
jgi:hypothetical protein